MLFEHPSLAQLSIRDWKVLCTGATTARYPRGHVILTEGQKDTCLYRIKEGIIRVVKSGVAVGKLGKNQVFGENAFIEGNSLAFFS